jgi:hypothetical protein
MKTGQGNLVRSFGEELSAGGMLALKNNTD